MQREIAIVLWAVLLGCLFPVAPRAADSGLDLWRVAQESGFERAGTLSAETETRTYFVGRRTGGSGDAALPMEILVYDRQSGDVAPLLDSKDSGWVFGWQSPPHPGCFEVSPSGRYLAVGVPKWQPDTSDIAIVDVSSKTVSVRVSDGFDNRGYFFSPDDRYLLYYAHPSGSEFTAQGGGRVTPCAVKLLEVSSGQTKTILPEPVGKMDWFQYEKNAAWSPDASLAVFSVCRPPQKAEGSTLVFKYDLASESATPLVSYRYGVELFRFLDNVRLLSVTSQEIDLICTADGKTQRLAKEGAMRDFHVSGDRISYRTGVGAGTMTKEVAIPLGD